MKMLQVVVGPLNTNCYIVYGGDKKAAVIDPGFSPEVILRVLEENGLTLEKILLTHAHFDHITAVEELRKRGAELYLHKDDEEMLYNSDLNYMRGFAGKELHFQKAEHLLEDGDIIEIGGETLTVLHTPGHTKGSVCYLSENMMFSGDTLFRDGIGRTDLYGGSFGTLSSSLERLKGLEKDYTVYPGHGERTALQYEKNNNIYMKF